MNEKVQAFLAKAEQEAQIQKKAKRDKHLISLGLVDETKLTQVEPTHPGAQYDKETDKFYVADTALEVTDEEYAAICRIVPEPDDEEINDYMKNNKIAVIHLAVVTVIMLINLFFAYQLHVLID